MIYSTRYTFPMRCRMYSESADITEVVVTGMFEKPNRLDGTTYMEPWAKVEGIRDPVAGCFLEPIRATSSQEPPVLEIARAMVIARGLHTVSSRVRFWSDRTVHVSVEPPHKAGADEVQHELEALANTFHALYRVKMLAWAADKVRAAMRNVERAGCACTTVALPAPIPYLLSDQAKDHIVRGWTPEPFLGMEVVGVSGPLWAAVYTAPEHGRFALVDL